MNPSSRKSLPSIFGFAGDRLAPEVMKRSHQHQELEINYLVRGGMTYLIGGDIRKIPAGKLTVLWAAAPHQVINIEKDSLFYWFTLPFAWVLQWNLPSDFVEHLLHGELARETRDAPEDAGLCQRWREDLKSGKNSRLRAAQLEMEARLLRLATGASWKNPGTSSSRRPESFHTSGLAVQKMLEVITRRYTDPLSVEEIARPTGMHPNYALTLFRRSLGITVMGYLKKHRLFHARRLLAISDRKIIDIAMESGFGSTSRFYEAFTKAYGRPPKHFRRKSSSP